MLQEYSKIKDGLCKKFADNLREYTIAKAPFLRTIDRRTQIELAISSHSRNFYRRRTEKITSTFSVLLWSRSDA